MNLGLAEVFAQTKCSVNIIKPVQGNQPWTLTGRTGAEADAPILWQPDVKSWLFGKDPDAGKDWGQEEKGMTEDEMVGWPHRLNGHGFEQSPRDSERQGSLACCSPWGRKESDTTVRLNNNKTSSSTAAMFVTGGNKCKRCYPHKVPGSGGNTKPRYRRLKLKNVSQTGGQCEVWGTEQYLKPWRRGSSCPRRHSRGPSSAPTTLISVQLLFLPGTGSR